jgi:hypothetical protein
MLGHDGGNAALPDAEQNTCIDADISKRAATHRFFPFSAGS